METNDNIGILDSKYNLKKIIGTGGTSIVYLSALENEKPERKVAIKVLKQKELLQSMGEDSMPCFDKIGPPIQLDAIFGAQGCEEEGPVTDCNVCNKTAKALSVTFLLNNDFFTNKISEI